MDRPLPAVAAVLASVLLASTACERGSTDPERVCGPGSSGHAVEIVYGGFSGIPNLNPLEPLPGAVTLPAGIGVLTVVARDSQSRLWLDTAVVWSSSDPAVVRIDTATTLTGARVRVLRAGSVGCAEIAAAVAGAADTLRVDVAAIDVAGTFALTDVNGSALPARYSCGPAGSGPAPVCVVESASYTLGADSTIARTFSGSDASEPRLLHGTYGVEASDHFEYPIAVVATFPTMTPPLPRRLFVSGDGRRALEIGPNFSNAPPDRFRYARQ